MTMSRYFDEKNDEVKWILFRDLMMLIMALIALGMWGYPQYNVWQQGLAGEAELKRAEQNRKIKVQEAQAALDSADLLSKAEVARAHGVAQANKIIGNSLHGNEAYLRYLWIQTLEHGKDNTIVYVPTETNLPILEAGRFKRKQGE